MCQSVPVAIRSSWWWPKGHTKIIHIYYAAPDLLRVEHSIMFLTFFFHVYMEKTIWKSLYVTDYNNSVLKFCSNFLKRPSNTLFYTDSSEHWDKENRFHKKGGSNKYLWRLKNL